MTYEAGPAASPAEATSFTGAEGTPRTARMIDGGRFMNFLIIPTVAYGSDLDLEGEVHIAIPRGVVLSQTVSAPAPPRRRRGFARRCAHGGLPERHLARDDRVLTLTNGAGDGRLFAVYDQVRPPR